ncbi:14883_t:CDS:1, partial [Gigaspora rosea]
LQHVSHTFIPASYITEQQPASNVIVPGQLANNLPIPGQQLANHITVVAGQQPATASHIIASGQQAASHIIVPGRHPPIIGHKKRGHKRTIYHKCIICKHECKSPKLLKEHNMIEKQLFGTFFLNFLIRQ